MTQLTAHFTKEEFEMDTAIPDDCVSVLTTFCNRVLEPIRDKFGPQKVTSGDRTVEANTIAHGQADSEHLYSATQCAADLEPLEAKAREVFDWCRLNPDLPYHQLILEHGKSGSSIVHVSMNILKPGIRSVLEGAEHNAEPYVQIYHVDFEPPTNRADVQEITSE